MLVLGHFGQGGPAGATASIQYPALLVVIDFVGLAYMVFQAKAGRSNR